MQNIIYYIGEFYRYPESKQLLKLKKVEGFIFIFDCGHRVTDCVFVDLIRIKTGVQVYKDKQLELCL